MSYICPGCGEEHEGFPAYQLTYPEEYLNLSDKDKKRKVKRKKDYLIIDHGQGHRHYYMQAHWKQKVKGTDHRWVLTVWVMVKKDHLELALKKQEKLIVKATLQSNIPYHQYHVVGYPIACIWNGEDDMLVVDSIQPSQSQVYRYFVDGMPLDETLDWINDFRKHIKQTECTFKPEI